MISSVPLGTGSYVGNRFILDERMGRGDMGAVFRGRDLRKLEARDLNSRVAIKVFKDEFKKHPNAMRALLREARKVQALDHPSIVKVYDFERDESSAYLTMEFLDGESLDRVIKRGGGVGLGFAEALRIIRDVCDAMTYAHGCGILHTDFKPSNVFLTHKGTVKVLDFGIARALRRGDWADSLLTLFDATALSAPSPAYSGCEVTEGKEPEVKDDIYAIGCVFYELLTGKHPFNGLSAEEASKKKMLAARPSNLSRSAWRTLRRALAFRRDRRPASALKFLDGLVPRRTAASMYFVSAAAACVAAVGMLSVTQVMTYRAQVVSAALVSANSSQIESVMPWLRALSPERRAALLSDATVRAGLLKYFTQRIDATVDPKLGRNDPAQANALIQELWSLLPDPQAVNSLSGRIGARQSAAPRAENAAPTTSAVKGHLMPVMTPVRLNRATWVQPAQPSVATRTSPPARTRTNAGTTAGASSRYEKWHSFRAEMAADGGGPAPFADRPARSKKKRGTTDAKVVSLKQPADARRIAAVTIFSQKLDSLSRIMTLKQAVISQASANQAAEAVATLDSLREHLSATDEFLVVEGPQAIAWAYLRLASNAASGGKIEEALSLSISGAKMAPTLKEAAVARNRYLAYWEISDLLRNRERVMATHVRFKIWRVSKLAPDEMPAITQRFERDLEGRIRAAEDPKLAARLSRAGQTIFGNSPSVPAPVEQVTAEAH